MIQQIKNILAAEEFAPFTIITSAGREIHVPTREHILVGTGAVTVLDSDGWFAYVSGLHITEIKSEERAKA